MQVVIFCCTALFAGAIGEDFSLIFSPIFTIFSDLKTFSFPASARFSEIKSSSSERIIGGYNTTIEKHPYQLSLRKNGAHECGSSVLTTTRALTAAHCIKTENPPSQYSIKAGSTYRLDQEDPKAQIRILSRYIQHPKFLRGVRNDIAIVIWQKPLVFGASVQPIVLPKSDYAVPYGKLGLTSGWGFTRRDSARLSERLQAVATPFITNQQCNRTAEYASLLTNDMICTGFEKGGRGFCKADSGGPLIDNSQKKFVLIGVVNWSIGCADARFPSVYAFVPHFTTWIRENM